MQTLILYTVLWLHLTIKMKIVNSFVVNDVGINKLTKIIIQIKTPSIV
jgi:hypothetical protein